MKLDVKFVSRPSTIVSTKGHERNVRLPTEVKTLISDK